MDLVLFDFVWLPALCGSLYCPCLCSWSHRPQGSAEAEVEPLGVAHLARVGLGLGLGLDLGEGEPSAWRTCDTYGLQAACARHKGLQAACIELPGVFWRAGLCSPWLTSMATFTMKAAHGRAQQSHHCYICIYYGAAHGRGYTTILYLLWRRRTGRAMRPGRGSSLGRGSMRGWRSRSTSRRSLRSR